MNVESLLSLVHNGSLLLALVLVFDLILQNWKIGQSFFQNILTGVVVGGIGTIIMFTPWVLVPGLVFDTRSVLLGICGLFFGVIPTIIAMLITGFTRVMQGGPGTIMGVSVIFATGTIGILWGRYRKSPLQNITWKELYGFGMVIHIVMLALAFTLPLESALHTINSIAIPVLLIYPIGTTVLGIILSSHLKREAIVQKIQESEIRYKIVAENTYDWEYWFGTDGKFIYCSPSCKEISGYSPEELLENQDLTWKMVYPEDMEIYKTHRETPAVEKQGKQVEFRIIRKDGEIKWIGHICRPVYDNKGVLLGTRGSNRDITEQKLSEGKLRQSEEKYRELTESLSDVIWILDTETLFFRYVSQSVEKLRGYSVEEVMSHPIDTAFLPEDRDGLINLIHTRTEAFLNGTEPPDRVYIDEVEQPCKDGSRIWTEISTSLYINDETGKPEVRGVSRDISERKRMEFALNKELNLIDSIMNSVPGLLYLYDDQGNLIRWNKKHEEITGYTAEELHNFKLLDWYKDSPEDIERVTKGVEKALAEGFASTEAYLRVKDGKKYLYDFTASRLVFGNKTYFTGIGIDITTRRQNEIKISIAQNELRETLKQLEHQLEENEKSRQVLLSISEDQQIARERATQLSKELLVAYDATLEGWAAALELREKGTAKHSRNVVNLTLSLAKAMDVPEADLAHIYRGSLLHDIGKLGIPDEILLSEGELKPHEWIEMKKHPDYAYRMLYPIEYLRPALEIPYAHHEKWDGSGYPRGLKGEEIPLSARIFSVIDVWDALLEDRTYRRAWSREKVVQYLQEQSGKQFDPKIVETFLIMVNSQNPAIEDSGPNE